jgi:hypothetical protein
MSEDARQPRSTVGLCATCIHAATVTSSKGSVFWLCRLSETNPAFKKYPALPVIVCAGYERTA